MAVNTAGAKARLGKAPPISILSVFRRSFSLLFRRLPQNTIFGLIYVLPIAVVLAVLPDTILSRYDFTEIASIPGAVFFIGEIAIYSIAAAAITFFTLQNLNGESPSLAAAFQTGILGMLPVYGGMLAYYLGVGIGFALIVIPGIYFMTTYILVTPAIISEDRGVSAAFSRSKALVIGYRWKVLFAVLLVAFLYMVVQFLGLSVFGLMHLVVDTGPLSIAEANAAIPATNAIGAPMSVFSVIFVAALYDEIRRVKEGTSAKDIAAIFD